MPNRSTPPHLVIPGSLPILPLPPATILFPSLVIAVPITRRGTLNLLAAVLREAEKAPIGPDGRRKLPIIGCAPLRGEAGEAKGGVEGVKQGGAAAENQLQVIRLPDRRLRGSLPVSDTSDDDDEDSDPFSGARASEPSQRPSVEAIFDWGCAARILRVDRLSGGGFLATLEGLSRIRIDRFTSVGFPYFVADVSVYAEQGLPRTAASLLPHLREVSQSLLTVVASLSLPPMVQNRVRAFVSGVTLAGAGSLADIMIATVETAWADKLDILATPLPEERVTKAIALLQKQKEMIEVTRKIGEKVSKNLSRQQRAFFLRHQLEAIRQELAELEGKGSSSSAGPKDTSDLLKRLGMAPAAGNGDADEGDELKELEAKIEAARMPPEALHVTLKEYKRLKRIPPQSVEHGVVLNYLNTLVELPWGRGTSDAALLDPGFVKLARGKLDDDHYGMEKVKRRLLEYLAVLRLRGEAEAEQEELKIKQEAEEGEREGQDGGVLKGIIGGREPEIKGLHSQTVGESALPSLEPASRTPAASSPTIPPAIGGGENVKPPASRKAPILCLVGPPGVGKTSIARSLAQAMGRKFHRISLGGVRDEAEIRGHRRTYVGAMPGLIAQCLRKVGANNPVVLLDEIDKVSSNNFHGDPSAALLEVLDPEQNWCFSDHYIGTPLDLSSVLFIATANTLDTISAPLLDRMEVIELSGYVYDEKLAIAKRYLLPKQVAANMLKPGQVDIADDVLVKVVTGYTREAGVRTLERELGSICRAKAVEYAETKDAQAGGEEAKVYNPKVAMEDIERILGIEKYESELTDQVQRPGVATGMAYQGSGSGGILYVEASTFPGTGRLKLTGSLGGVISESAQLALSWVKAHAWELGLSADREDDRLRGLDVHLHLPSGAVRKDGPSAGVAMVCCLVSLLAGKPLRPGLAMTGEITLRGQVTAVGGIREKVLGAHRAGITHVILPFRNRQDVEADLPPRVKDEVTFTFVRNIHEVLEAAFGDSLYDSLDLRGWSGKEERRRRLELVESRL